MDRFLLDRFLLDRFLLDRFLLDRFLLDRFLLDRFKMEVSDVFQIFDMDLNMDWPICLFDIRAAIPTVEQQLFEGGRVH